MTKTLPRGESRSRPVGKYRHVGSRRLSGPGTRLRFALLLLLVPFLGAAGDPLPSVVAAAKAADWERLEGLIRSGADVKEAYGDGATALHWASYHENLDAVTSLLAAGADPGAKTDLGVTPLSPAAQNGNPEVTRLLLEAGADPGATLRSGETLVMTAALSGNPEVVRLLLEAGADPNAAGVRGQTALMWAAGEGHTEAVSLLLKHGAEVDAATEVRHQYMKTEKAQESNSAYHVWVDMGGHTALFFAARAGHLEAARALIEAGADVDHLAAFGITPTIMAIHGGNDALVSLLLDRGADPNRSTAGYQALHAAILHGKSSIARLLLDHGADPEAILEKPTPTRRGSDDYHFHNAFVGATPLWLAARFSQPETMKALLARGADPTFVLDCRYPAGDREEQWEEVEGPVSVVMAAVGLGGRSVNSGYVVPPADVRELAVLEAVHLAVEAGADLSVVDAKGSSALHGAYRRGYELVAGYLESLGLSR